MPFAIVLAALVLLYLFAGLRQVNEWEVALRFTLGRYRGKARPGLRHFLPIVQKLVRVDTRTRNRDLLRQMVITRDNVTTMIDAVVYYRVIDPEKAALAVEDYETAVTDLAKVVLRDVVGETGLDELLSHREEIATKVRTHVETVVAQWGIHVELIGLQDVQLPGHMQEVLAKAAIAERDRRYVVVKSMADVESAKNFAEAARTLAGVPGAMELRRFEALTTISQTGNTKVIFDLAKPYDDVARTAAQFAEAATTESTSHGARIEGADAAGAMGAGVDDFAAGPAVARTRRGPA